MYDEVIEQIKTVFNKPGVKKIKVTFHNGQSWDIQQDAVRRNLMLWVKRDSSMVKVEPNKRDQVISLSPVEFKCPNASGYAIDIIVNEIFKNHYGTNDKKEVMCISVL